MSQSGRSHHSRRRTRSVSSDGDCESPVSLYVRNIPIRATHQDLRRVFSAFGGVRDVYVPLDYHTGEPRGFAYVEFHHPEDARLAVEEANALGLDLFGNNIHVTFAMGDRKSPREMRSKYYPDRGGPSGGRFFRGRGRGGRGQAYFPMPRFQNEHHMYRAGHEQFSRGRPPFDDFRRRQRSRSRTCSRSRSRSKSRGSSHTYSTSPRSSRSPSKSPPSSPKLEEVKKVESEVTAPSVLVQSTKKEPIVYDEQKDKDRFEDERSVKINVKQQSKHAKRCKHERHKAHRSHRDKQKVKKKRPSKSKTPSLSPPPKPRHKHRDKAKRSLVKESY